MQSVCLSCRRSQEPLANKGCHLPLCFAPEPQGISSTSHRASILGALRCKADQNDDVRQALLDTAGRPLRFYSTSDLYFGCSSSGLPGGGSGGGGGIIRTGQRGGAVVGFNRLGYLLEIVRREIIAAADSGIYAEIGLQNYQRPKQGQYKLISKGPSRLRLRQVKGANTHHLCSTVHS